MTSSEKMSFSLIDGFGYMVYVPEKRQAGEKLPLVVFLHGAGERGDDTSRVAVHGPMKRIQNGWRPDFICVAPQCPENCHWTDKTEKLKIFIDLIAEKYGADTNRIYITGLSMGGFGTWAMLSRWSTFFAAAVPVCGGGSPWTAGEFYQVPIWAFHGDADDTVNVSYSRDMVSAVNDHSSCPDFAGAKLTEYPGVGHDSWTATYDNDEMWAWLLSHKKK